MKILKQRVIETIICSCNGFTHYQEHLKEQLLQYSNPYAAQLTDIINAGNLKVSELKSTLDVMQQNLDEYDPHEVSDLVNFIKLLEERLTFLQKELDILQSVTYRPTHWMPIPNSPREE